MAIPGEFRWPPVGRNRCPLTARSNTRMMMKSGQCRSTPERITAISIIHGIGPQK